MAASLPEGVAKDLILQVFIIHVPHVKFFYVQYGKGKIMNLTGSFTFQGLRQIRIGCKLQEVAAKYQSEGFLCVYITCAGTDAQKLIDLLEDMFGELGPDDVDPEQLELKVTQVLRQEATTSEEAAIETAHGQIPAD